MLKRFIFYLSGLVIFYHAAAQQSFIDSLLEENEVLQNDTIRLINLGKISNAYAEINSDSCYHYGNIMQREAKRMKLKLEEGFAYAEMAYALINLGNYPRALQNLLSGVAIADDPSSEKYVLPGSFTAIDEYSTRSVSAHLQRLQLLSRMYQYMGILYGNSQNYNKAVSYYRSALPLAEQTDNLKLMSIIYSTMGRAYLTLKNKDSALYCLQRSYDLTEEAGYSRYLGSVYLNLGRVYSSFGMGDSAKIYFRKGATTSEENNYFRGVVASYLELAALFKNSLTPDSSLYYIELGLPIARYLNAPDLFLRSYRALAEYYKLTGNNDSTVKYQSLMIRINDSLFNSSQVRQFQNIDFDEQQRQQQIEEAKTAYRNKVNINLLIAGLATFLVIAIILWRGRRNEKSAKERISRQKEELEVALKNLKSAQDQLIQSEKMASLGELTAGIAHEIKNPLNFVNNFSEVNTELIDELDQEIANGNMEEVKAIAKNIRENEEKINQHGKRADAIVRSMLMHSRTASGNKEVTDINALTEEYFRLAYHGLRAKDKSFTATFETDFDPSIEKKEIAAQDIGRVILNLINNAFYAVNEKKEHHKGEYEPTISLKTKNKNGRVEIRIADNGNGIPEAVKEKIFQPFFTTKPTGQGTGLGLSLSYDIITKGHGGELRVNTTQGEGTEFIIIL